MGSPLDTDGKDISCHHQTTKHRREVRATEQKPSERTSERAKQRGAKWGHRGTRTAEAKAANMNKQNTCRTAVSTGGGGTAAAGAVSDEGGRLPRAFPLPTGSKAGSWGGTSCAKHRGRDTWLQDAPTYTRGERARRASIFSSFVQVL